MVCSDDMVGLGGAVVGLLRHLRNRSMGSERMAAKASNILCVAARSYVLFC